MPIVNQPGQFTLQVLTSTGAPAVNYRLYTYTAGTTTHKVAYTDSAGSVAHTYGPDGSGGEYIALDARGELPAPLWLASGAYDIALKTPAGATVWTRRAEGALSAGGVGVFALGTAAAPGIAFDGDGNSGIYSPGADQVSISTNGLERIKVAASGAIELNGATSVGTGFGLSVSGTKVYPASFLNGAGVITTSIPYGAASTVGGGLLLISGADIAGLAFCALYVVATRLPFGGVTGSALLIDRTGVTDPSLTVAVNSGGDGFITVTVGATNANLTWVSGFGF